MFNKIKQIHKLGKMQFWSAYQDKMREEHPLRYLFWEITHNCNFHCRHCGSRMGEQPRVDELTATEIMAIFKTLAEDYDARQIMVAVTGGEPLLRPDLCEVMSYAHKLGFPWGMVTNGFLLDANMAKKLRSAGMSTVVVSIDGLAESHDSFRQCAGAYQHAVEAVRWLREAAFLQDLQITTCVHQGNIHDLSRMYDVFSSLGINSWRLMNVDPIGRAEDHAEMLLTPKQLAELLVFIKEKRQSDKKIEIKYGCAGFLGPELESEVRGHLFFCNAGINVGSILNNGDIFVCPNVPRRPELIQGNVRRERFSTIWNERYQFFRRKDRQACADCRGCEWWDNCLGNSLHLWNFDLEKPKLCHYHCLQEKDS